MNHRITPIMIILISLLLGGYPSFSQTAEELLPKAIQLEEVKGELEKALEIYQTIVSEYPDNRPVAAKAYYHIGMCYEKLGKKDAMKAYKQVIQNYGEQKEVVAKAQGRLSILQPSKLAEKPDGIRIRQIWKKSYLDFLGTVSSDGNFFSYVDWDSGEGDLAIHNLVTGERRLLTNKASPGDTVGFTMSSSISKNNKQVAYSNWSPYHTFDLNVVDIDNPSPRVLYRQEGVEVYPVTWFSDKELIAIRENRRTEITNITLFNVVKGTFHDLKTFDGRIWPHISCSPDENYIAYDFEKENKRGNFDINVLDVEGGSEISLVNHPANDRVIGWIPGRKEFLFISDRSGTWDLWALPVKDGKPSGTVKRVYTDIGDVHPMGFTKSGDCFFGFSRRNFNCYIAPFNTRTGELNEESGKSMLGSNIWVKWSPDGQYLTYINLAENPPPLTIQNLKTGEERKLGDNLHMAMSPCWSPDGNSILVIGRDKRKDQTKVYKGDIYLVDVKTGQTTEILLISDYKYNLPDDDAFPLSDLEWSSDGKSIFFLFFKDRLVKHNLITGEDKILYKHSHFNRGVLSRSPDGRSLLFAVYNPEEKKSHLFTMPIEGGEEKELCISQESDDFKWGYWSPDGKYIYFTERPEETNLWRVPAEGGTPEKIWHSKDRTEFFSIHPDGKQIVLAKRERTTEIRVIENLVQELEKNDKLSE